MGQQHVTLNIGEDGLVKSVGHDMGGSYEIETPKLKQLEIPFEDIYEDCIMCGKKTTVSKTTHIDFRDGYIEGAGQLCIKCWNKGTEHRHMTVPMNLVYDTPNDAELGAAVRRLYHENNS